VPLSLRVPAGRLRESLPARVVAARGCRAGERARSVSVRSYPALEGFRCTGLRGRMRRRSGVRPLCPGCRRQ